MSPSRQRPLGWGRHALQGGLVLAPGSLHGAMTAIIGQGNGHPYEKAPNRLMQIVQGTKLKEGSGASCHGLSSTRST